MRFRPKSTKPCTSPMKAWTTPIGLESNPFLINATNPLGRLGWRERSTSKTEEAVRYRGNMSVLDRAIVKAFQRRREAEAVRKPAPAELRAASESLAMRPRDVLSPAV